MPGAINCKRHLCTDIDLVYDVDPEKDLARGAKKVSQAGIPALS